MKARFLFLTLFLAITAVSSGQQKSGWDHWKWLMGEWQGEGEGQPGQGGGTFTFVFDLDENIIIRKSHSEYPQPDNKPVIIHDDLMIVYPDLNTKSDKAIYFDNEAHSISYQVTYSDRSIVMTSDKTSGVPVFRLTYTLVTPGTINTKFEISPDGNEFMTYLEGKSRIVRHQDL